MIETISYLEKILINKETPHCFVRCFFMLENDEEFRKIYDNADIILVDGNPLVWIAKLLKNRKNIWIIFIS